MKIIRDILLSKTSGTMDVVGGPRDVIVLESFELTPLGVLVPRTTEIERGV